MGYRYERYEENSTHVVLPGEIEGKPVTIIGAKAFLSCRQVESLTLPDTLEKVEDWAFAHMKGLRDIVFPARRILFGKKTFLGCDGLQRVLLTCGGETVQGQYEGMPFFLASVFRLGMEKMRKDLSDFRLAGDAEGQWQWLASYDEAVAQYLMRPDDYDFEPAFIGWFDVEDVDDQRAGYMTEQRKKKIALVFQRLLYSERISEQTEKIWKEYLVKRVPEQVLEQMRDVESGYGSHVKYFRIWQKIGGFERYSPKFLLGELVNADPEVKGFLLECELAEAAGNDFFGNLEL